MPRTVADRICIRIHEAAQFHLARCRCLAGIVAGIIDSRSVKLNDIASQFQGKANFMSKYRRLQLFFQQVAFNQGTLAKLIAAALALEGKLTLALDRTTWERRGNMGNDTRRQWRLTFGPRAAPGPHSSGRPPVKRC